MLLKRPCYANCGKYDHIRAFTVETPRRGVSTKFMIAAADYGDDAAASEIVLDKNATLADHVCGMSFR